MLGLYNPLALPVEMTWEPPLAIGRACFTTPLTQATLTETYQLYDRPTPLTAPGWFDCFDADAIGEALLAGGKTPAHKAFAFRPESHATQAATEHAAGRTLTVGPGERWRTLAEAIGQYALAQG